MIHGGLAKDLGHHMVGSQYQVGRWVILNTHRLIAVDRSFSSWVADTKTLLSKAVCPTRMLPLFQLHIIQSVNERRSELTTRKRYGGLV